MCVFFCASRHLVSGATMPAVCQFIIVSFNKVRFRWWEVVALAPEQGGPPINKQEPTSHWYYLGGPDHPNHSLRQCDLSRNLNTMQLTQRTNQPYQDSNQSNLIKNDHIGLIRKNPTKSWWDALSSDILCLPTFDCKHGHCSNQVTRISQNHDTFVSFNIFSSYFTNRTPTPSWHFASQ